jgi:hypothetical protein
MLSGAFLESMSGVLHCSDDKDNPPGQRSICSWKDQVVDLRGILARQEDRNCCHHYHLVLTATGFGSHSASRTPDEPCKKVGEERGGCHS